MTLLITGQFLTAGAAATGLTVTCDLWRITRSSGTTSQVVTAQSATEIGGGGYFYRYTGDDLETYAYFGRLNTAGTADQTDIGFFFTDFHPLLTNGDVTIKSDLNEILGTAIAESTSGRIAANFDEFFDNDDAVSAVTLADIGAIKTETDKLTFTGSDLHATLDGEAVTVSGTVDANVTQFLGTAIAESTSGRIAANFDNFYDNSDALTTKTVDDVGTATVGGTVDANVTQFLGSPLIELTSGRIANNFTTLFANNDNLTTKRLDDIGDVDSILGTAIVESTGGRIAANFDEFFDNDDAVSAVTLADIGAIKTETDKLTFTGSDLHATLDGEAVTVSGTVDANVTQFLGTAIAETSAGNIAANFDNFYDNGDALTTKTVDDVGSVASGTVDANVIQFLGTAIAETSAGNIAANFDNFYDNGDALTTKTVDDVGSVASGTVDANVIQFLGTAIAETSAGNIAANFDNFYDNGDALTTKTVDDVGSVASGTVDANVIQFLGTAIAETSAGNIAANFDNFYDNGDAITTKTVDDVGTVSGPVTVSGTVDANITQAMGTAITEYTSGVMANNFSYFFGSSDAGDISIANGHPGRLDQIWSQVGLIQFDGSQNVLSADQNILLDGDNYIYANVWKIQGTGFTESTPGRIANNLSTFFDNSDAATTKTVDDVGAVASGTVDANVIQFLGTAIAETSAGNIAANFDNFYDNGDALTTKTVDDVGAVASGTVDANVIQFLGTAIAETSAGNIAANFDNFYDNGDALTTKTVDDVANLRSINGTVLSGPSVAANFNTFFDGNGGTSGTVDDVHILNSFNFNGGDVIATLDGESVAITGAVDANVIEFLGTAIAETSAGNIAANFDNFYDNGDALTTKVIDDVGAGAGGSFWSTVEQNQIRHRLGIDGTSATPTASPNLGTVDANLIQILGASLNEATNGRIAGNFDTFFENSDAATTKTVDDVGTATVSGTVDANVTQFLGTAIAETSAGNIAANFDNFYDNGDALTTKTVDDVGTVSAPVTVTGTVDANVTQFLGTAIAETSAGNIAANFDNFYDNGDALTTKTVDDVGSVASGTVDANVIEFLGTAIAETSAGNIAANFDNFYDNGDALTTKTVDDVGTATAPGTVNANVIQFLGTAIAETSAGNIAANFDNFYDNGDALTAITVDDISSIKSKTDNLTFTGTDLQVTLDGEAVTVTGTVDANVTQFLGTAIAETSAGNIAANFDNFYDNSDALTTKTVDDIGTATVSGTVDANVTQFLGTAIAETTAGNIAANFDNFYDNGDALTTKTVDDVGATVGTVDANVIQFLGTAIAETSAGNIAANFDNFYDNGDALTTKTVDDVGTATAPGTVNANVIQFLGTAIAETSAGNIAANFDNFYDNGDTLTTKTVDDVGTATAPGTVNANVTQFLGTAIAETSAGNIAANFDNFYDNGDALTTKTVDDVGTATAPGTVDANITQINGVNVSSHAGDTSQTTNFVSNWFTFFRNGDVTSSLVVDDVGNVRKIIGVAIAESTSGRIAGNFTTFFENSDAATTKVVDNVGTAVVSGTVNANIVQVLGTNVTGVDDFKADVSGLSTFDATTDTVQANVRQYLGTTITETTSGRIAANFATFYDNSDSLTTRIVDNVGSLVSPGTLDVNVIEVNGSAVTGVDDFKADVSGLSTFDATTDTVLADVREVNNVAVTGVDDFKADVSGLSTFDATTDTVQANVRQYLGTTITETTSGRIAANFATFYDNSDALTTRVVDNVGSLVSPGTLDVNVIEVNGSAVTGVDDFKADVSGLSTFDATTDTVLADVREVNNVAVTGVDDFKADVSGLSTFDATTDTVQANVRQYLGTTITETTSGRIAANFATFYDNSDALTTRVVDNVGSLVSPGTLDVNVIEVNGSAVTGVDDFKADVSGLSTFDATTDTVLADVREVNNVAVTGVDDFKADVSGLSTFDATTDTVQANVRQYLGTTITETTSGRIAANFATFYDNSDALTTRIVDNVGSIVSGTVDANVTQFLGTAIAETSAGNIAANFDNFYDNSDALTTRIVDNVGSVVAGTVDVNVIEVNGSAVTGVDDFKADVSGLSTFDATTDTVLADVREVNNVAVTGVDDFKADVSGLSTFDATTDTVQANVRQYLGTTITETTAGRIADNLSTFYDNSDALTTRVVDNVGSLVSPGTLDVNVIEVNGSAVTGVDDFKADVSGLSTFDATTDTVLADVREVNNVAVTGVDDFKADVSGLSTFDATTDTVQANVRQYLGTTITETTAGRIADNLSTFYDNSDALTTRVVDNVGSFVSAGTLDVNVIEVNGSAVTGVDDFKADVSGLSTFDATTDTVLADVREVNNVAVTGVDDFKADVSGLSTFDATTDTVLADIRQYLGTTITETTAGRIADNLSTFYDNSDALTTVVVDDIGDIDSQTSQLTFTGSDVHSTLDGESVTVGALIQAALAQFVTVDTGETSSAAGSVVRLSQAVGSIDAAALEAVWTYTPRTLTMSAAQVADVLSAGNVSVIRGSTWTISFTGLSDLTAYEKLYFTVKENPEKDSDDVGLLRISDTVGLELFNDSTSVTAGDASLTVTDAAAGDITVTVSASVTADAPVAKIWRYGIKGIDTDGSGQVDVLSVGGKFTVIADVTRAVS